MIQTLYGISIFLAAFLLFFIQPMIAKAMLPAFGGAGIVWISTLVFFQIVLLIGYLYAYLLSKYCSLKSQAAIHVILMCLSLSFIPVYLHQISLEGIWSPWAVLLLLSKSVLLPCVVISASSPLLQHWYCQIRHTTFPYIYYSISNAGSLIGLLGYPFLLEPLIGLKMQRLSWSIVYGIYILLCIGCLTQLLFVKNVQTQTNEQINIKNTAVYKWLLLTFLSSALLVSTTQFLVQNVMNLPLLWVLPLVLYLISYIVIFSRPKPYARDFWAASFMFWLMLFLWLLYHSTLAGMNVIIVVFALLYSACMVCHGELIKTKPPMQDLTLFYLAIALGGVLGGIFSNIVALLLFVNWWDLYIPLIIINIIVIAILSKQYLATKSRWDLSLNVIGMLSLVGLVYIAYCNSYQPMKSKIAQFRNPYGFIKVYDFDSADPKFSFRGLLHGMVMHGVQFKDKEKAKIPTMYFSHQSGVGLAFDYLRSHHETLKVGIVGLGCGTLAAYGVVGDQFTFYEIDPDMEKIAKNYFSYVGDSKAKINFVTGDARIQLQKKLPTKESEKYNLLVVDAFSGDSVPAHLLTVEALKLYEHYLTKNGILALHTSNTYLDFMPVTKSLALQQGCNHYWIRSNINIQNAQADSTWALISCDKGFNAWLGQHNISSSSDENVQPRMWTDDFNTILPLLKW